MQNSDPNNASNNRSNMNNTNAPISIEEQHKTALSDLASLGRVSHRLALVDTSQKLQAVLDKLLPRLLQRIGDNNQSQLRTTDSQLKDALSKIHLKLVEMLSHTMKRVRDDKSCKLNAAGIMELLLAEKPSSNSANGSILEGNYSNKTAKQCDSFSLNLSLTFLTLAIPRCTATELETLLPGLLILHACYEANAEETRSSPSSSSSSSPTKKQWHQVSHILLRTLERIIIETESSPRHTTPTGINGNKRIKTSTTGSSNEEGETREKESQQQQSSLIPKTGLEQARELLSQEVMIASATYELFLDAFMYETQLGNVPPAGLSSAGWERLKDGHSLTERDWAAEMAPPSRLALFKTRMVEWISPSRRWSLFFVGNSKGKKNNDEKSQDDTPTSLGVSRTVALLTTASGDSMQTVSELAKQYLKQYFDSQRESGGFGDTSVLAKELLGLCCGGINSDLVLDTATSSISPNTLGLLHLDVSFRRRQVSDSNFSELIGAVTKVISEVTDEDIEAVGKLAILATDKMLSKLRNALGLSLLRGKPYIAAAELLNGLVVKLEHVKSDDKKIEIFNTEARALTLATQVLAPVGSALVTSSTGAMSEASVAVRDSIYGTISIISRSRFAQERFLCVMAAGNMETNSLSMDLLQLLLRCVSNEVDKLKLRATAALDALLFACRRAVDGCNQHKYMVQPSLADNPWGLSSSNSRRLQAQNLDESLLSKTLAKSLLPILWNATRKSQSRQSRVAAARWSSVLLLDLDVINGTHILCFLAGDSDVTASSIAREGLGLTETKDTNIADFSGLVEAILTTTTASRPTFWGFSSEGKAVAVKCLLRSYLDDFHGEGEEKIYSLMDVLARTLEDKSTNGDLLDSCSEALSVCVGASAAARSMIQSSSVCLGVQDMTHLILSASSSKARRFLADAFCNLLMDVSLFNSQWVYCVSEAMSTSAGILKKEPLQPSVDVHGAALLGGVCIRLFRLNPDLVRSDEWGTASRTLSRLGDGLLNADDSIGNVFSDAVLLACSGDPVPKLHESLNPGMSSLLKKVASSLNKFGSSDRVNAPRVLKIVEPTGLAISVAIASSCEDIAASRTECVDALFRLLGSDAFRKDEEIALSTGEALAKFCESYIPMTSSVPMESGSGDWPPELNEIFLKNASPPVQVLYWLLRTAKTTTNNHKRRACAPALLGVVARAAKLQAKDQLHRCLQFHLHEVQECFLLLLTDAKSNQLSRESCCLGLASCNKLAIPSESNELKGRLLKAFGQTTNYGSSAMQETPEQAEQRRRAERMNDDGESPAADASAIVDIGGAAGMSEASLGAYREMAAAAVASGRPDILYSMLILSVSHPIWTSSVNRRDAYGPSALQGDSFNREEVKIALRPFLSRLLPRILRACHDPNKQTREQMETLWVGLTGGGEEGRHAISANIRPTIDALVEETSSKFWRARVGACGALAQIIVGRSWQELGGGPPVLDENYDFVISKTSSESTIGGIRLLRLWRAVIRALDDVRVTVRESGETLGRSVRGLTVQLCNPNVDSFEGSTEDRKQLESDAISASATALRWLLRNGLKQQCPEAAGVSISALIGIIDIARPAILEALLSDVIFALLMAMSNLEPAAFNYLAVRQEQGSSDYENLARLRLQASQSSPLAMAVRKCVDLVPKSSSKHQEAVVPALESAIRKSSGIATRTAAAECVITLCHSCPEMFRSNASSSSLLRCFFESVFQERGGKAAQDKMNAAFGSLASLCPGTAVRSLASSASERYKESHGNNDDAATRQAAAMVLRSVAVKASNQFSDPGNSDVWCKKVLPVSFLGMRDPDTSVASLWKEVWEDGGSSVNLGSEGDDGNTIDEKLLLGLTKESVKALGDVSWTRRVTGAAAIADLSHRGILSPPPRRLNDETFQMEYGRARKRAQASRLALSSLVRLVARSRIWSGKNEVVRAIANLAIAWIPFAGSKEAKVLLGDPELAPISFGNVATDKDLFFGDSWFADSNVLHDENIDGSDQDEAFQTSDGSASDEVLVVLVVGLCRLLLVQAFPGDGALRAVAEEEVLPYRSDVLQSFERLLKSLPDDISGIPLRERIFSFVAPRLSVVFSNYSTNESPLIVARTVDCFAGSFWSHMRFEKDGESALDSVELSLLFLHHVDFSKQPAWTVREAAAKASGRIVQCANIATLRHGKFVSSFVDVASVALKDRKFWKVRLAGLQVLYAIVLRSGKRVAVGNGIVETAQEKQLILESILPHKESIQDLAKRSLHDSEAQVTALATKILSILSTWP